MLSFPLQKLLQSEIVKKRKNKAELQEACGCNAGRVTVCGRNALASCLDAASPSWASGLNLTKRISCEHDVHCARHRKTPEQVESRLPLGLPSLCSRQELGCHLERRPSCAAAPYSPRDVTRRELVQQRAGRRAGALDVLGSGASLGSADGSPPEGGGLLLATDS